MGILGLLGTCGGPRNSWDAARHEAGRVGNVGHGNHGDCATSLARGSATALLNRRLVSNRRPLTQARSTDAGLCWKPKMGDPAHVRLPHRARNGQTIK